jgi:diaminopimelate decarboxylase
LNVHVDSLTEASTLGLWSRDLNWRLGVRLHVREEFDPDETSFGDQFGMTSTETGQALDILRGLGADVFGLHFHLRSNVDSAKSYRHALTEAAEFCRAAGFRPTYVDTGGGLPDPGVGPSVAPQYFSDLGRSVDLFAREVGGIAEVWMEHGRFVTGRSAVLVVTVCDVKERPDCRYLICDGGRTNHALVSDWEQHRLVVLPARVGAATLTTVAGPTCMAFDKFGRFMLPNDVGVGDLLVWMNAGAYHIPWETRFSRGLCRVVWCPGGTELQLARGEETFDSWWGQWL